MKVNIRRTDIFEAEFDFASLREADIAIGESNDDMHDTLEKNRIGCVTEVSTATFLYCSPELSLRMFREIEKWAPYVLRGALPGADSLAEVMDDYVRATGTTRST